MPEEWNDQKSIANDIGHKVALVQIILISGNITFSKPWEFHNASNFIPDFLIIQNKSLTSSKKQEM